MRTKTVIAEHTNIVPPPIKAKDFQDILAELWSQLNVETPDPESQPAGILFRKSIKNISKRCKNFNTKCLLQEWICICRR